MMKKTDQEWADELTPDQYRILRMKGTEAPGSGAYLDLSEDGMYSCAACGTDLFSSEAKYHSGCGWPSFYESSDRVGRRDDDSLGMKRIEIYCKHCDGHLGHVFPDGPQPTGERHCVNSLALKFKAKKGGVETE